jgi:hypothetical protein
MGWDLSGPGRDPGRVVCDHESRDAVVAFGISADHHLRPVVIFGVLLSILGLAIRALAGQTHSKAGA